MNLTDTIKTLKTDLDRVEDLVASGNTTRADAVLFRLKSDLNKLHYEVWLTHHKSASH